MASSAQIDSNSPSLRYSPGVQASHVAQGNFIASHDGLRGLAAMMVVLFHIENNGHFAMGLADIPWISNAWIFVDLFFVLSGFMMFWSYGNRLNNQQEVKTFLIRRFGRLFPLHLAMLLAFTAVWFAVQSAKWALLTWQGSVSFDVAPFAGPEVNGFDFLLNLFLLQGVGIEWTDAFNFPSWSVSLEFWMYLVFAGLCLPLARTRWLPVAFGALVASALLWYAHWFTTIPDYGQTIVAERNFFRIFLSFGIGVIAAWLRRRSPTLPSGLDQWGFVVTTTALLLIAMLDEIGILMLAAPWVFAALIYLLSYNSGRLASSLTHPCLMWLGERSYSIYMVHAVVLVGFKAIASRLPADWGFVLATVYLLAVLCSAHWAHRLIETPSRRYFGKLAARSGAAASPPGKSPEPAQDRA